jgi:hypothetical protein
VTGTLNHWQKLQAAGVQFKSFTEQYLDSTSLFREAIIGFLAAIASRNVCVSLSASRPGQPVVVNSLVAPRRLRIW